MENGNPSSSFLKPKRPAPPPPGFPSEEQLRTYFDRVDTDKNGSIAAEELQNALANGYGTGFNKATVRLMIGLFDKSRDGSIGFSEFGALWRYVVDWQTCFRTFDADKSGTITPDELERALVSFGYNLSPPIHQLLVKRFDRTKTDGIHFDDFIQCCIVLNQVTDAFRAEDTDMDGVITISYDKFLNMIFSISAFDQI